MAQPNSQPLSPSTSPSLLPPEGSKLTPQSTSSEVSGVNRNEFDALKNIIYAVFFIVALGFLSLLLTYFNERKASYENLLERVNNLELNVKCNYRR